MQSKELTQFYNEIQAWIDSGCDNKHDHFRIEDGLCYNLHRWARNAIPDDKPSKLTSLMQTQFINAGLPDDLPFNDSYEQFHHEQCWLALYKNEHRLKWIKDHQ